MKKILIMILLSILATITTTLFVTTYEGTREDTGPVICAALSCGGDYEEVVQSNGWPASVTGTEYANISYGCAREGSSGLTEGFDVDEECVNEAIQNGRDSSIEEFFSVTGLFLNFGAYFVLSASLIAMGEVFVSVLKQQRPPK